MTCAPVWATCARENRRMHTQNPDVMNEDLQAIDAIEYFLTGGLSIPKAARCIADICEPCLRTRQRNDIAILWAIICQAARSIDGDAPAQLAELVIALRNQPDVISSSGRVVEFGYWVYWRDLPKFSQMFWEYGMTIADPDCNDAEWHAQAPELLNITIFAANLMVHADRKPNVSFAASIAMYEGVDWPYDDTRELREMWRMYLPPAATWIMIAGSKIRELCFMDQLPDDDNKHSVQSQWEGRTYCAGRWTFWKRRFWELAWDTAIDMPCRVYAKAAHEIMDRLDDEA